MEISSTKDKKQTAYKDTPIGKIPADWEVKKIGEITQTIAGGTPSTKKSEYWGGNIRWMSSGELNLKKVYDVEGRITEEGLRNSSAKLLPPKCVLIGLAGQGKTRGTIAMNLVELCTNQSVAAILPSSSFYEDYLFHNLDSRYSELRQLSTGDGGRGGLNLKIINSLYVPLPPLPEQQRIAEVLNTWDQAIQCTEQLILQKEQRKKWLMQQLLSEKRIVKNEKWCKSGVKEVRLKDIAKVTMGQSPNSEDYNTEAIGPPLIQGNADLINRRQVVRFWTSQSNKECDAGDIIMTVRAPVGAIGLATQKSSIGRGVCSIKPKNIDYWYLYHILVFKEEQWKKLEQGSTFTAVGSKDIFHFPLLIVHSIEEQTAIAEVLQAADKEIELLKSKAEKLKEQKKGLMQQLLTGKKRLNLNLQD